MLPLHSRVTLRFFNGTLSKPRGHRDPRANYWILIGEQGVVVETVNADDRVLVRFDRSVLARDLHCHNPIPNTLYILESDLEQT